MRRALVVLLLMMSVSTSIADASLRHSEHSEEPGRKGGAASRPATQVPRDARDDMSAVLAEGPRLTTVILVRHAEKAGGEAAAMMSADPPLNDLGTARARELARVLGSTKIDAIYTTQYARTRLTAEPLGAAVKVTPQVFEAGKTYAAAMAAKIRNDHRGQTVVVVGHSNSTGNVMKELGVADVPPIAETQYDDLFIVTFAEGDVPTVVALRYGAVAR